MHISSCMCLHLGHQEDCAALNNLKNLEFFQASEPDCSSHTSILCLGEIWAQNSLFSLTPLVPKGKKPTGVVQKGVLVQAPDTAGQGTWGPDLLLSSVSH